MSVSDNFNRANGGLGANWTTIKGTWSIVSNQAQDDGLTSLANAAFWSGNSFNKDQSSQVVVVNFTTYNGVGARLKDHGAGQPDGYVFFPTISQIQILQNGSNSTLVGTSAGPAAGHTVKIDCTGTTITAYDNGSSVGSVTDSTWDGTGAAPGLTDYGNGVTLTYDDWVGTGEVVTGDTQEWRGCVEDVGVRRRNPISAMYRTIVDWLTPKGWRPTCETC